jgi:exoribonuclease R
LNNFDRQYSSKYIKKTKKQNKIDKMEGTVVLTKGLCIVEYEGERLYLSRDQAENLSVGDKVIFTTIVEDTPLRQIQNITPLRTRNKISNKDEYENDSAISCLFKNYGFTQTDHWDLTKLQTFSIDPKGSTDLDDAISTDNNNIYVHIAYFELDDALDKQAYERQYSIYLPENIYHLLPIKLATRKYSLLQDKLRLTWTVQFDINMNFIGVYKAYIINKHQISYDEAHENIHYLKTVYQVYRRFGFIVNDSKISSIRLKEMSESYKVIEFFMVQANKAIADYLTRKNILFPRRAHDTSINDESGFSAYYTTQEKSHDALNIDNYTHFTSPIRRYVDQVISKILLGERYSKEQLDDICTRANVQEKKIDLANEACQSMLMQGYLREHSEHEGEIILVSTWGIHVSMPQIKTTAQLHISRLSIGERLIYENNSLKGHRGFSLGDKIKLYAKFEPDLTWYYCNECCQS